MISLLLAFSVAFTPGDDALSRTDRRNLQRADPAKFVQAVLVFRDDLIASRELPESGDARDARTKELFQERTSRVRDFIGKLSTRKLARHCKPNYGLRWYTVELTPKGAFELADWAGGEGRELGLHIRLNQNVQMIGPGENPALNDGPADKAGRRRIRLTFPSATTLTGVFRSGAKFEEVEVGGPNIKAVVSAESWESLRRLGVVGSLSGDEAAAMLRTTAKWRNLPADAPRETVKCLDAKTLASLTGKKWNVSVLSVKESGVCEVAGEDAHAFADAAKSAERSKPKRTGAEMLPLVPKLSDPKKSG